MSTTQNLAYSAIQVVHNFGAVTTVGGSLAALKFRDADSRKGLARLVLAGLGIQTVSGAAFGAVSYFFYHRFPDIAGIAVVALEIKILCVIIGFLLLATCLFRGDDWTVAKTSIILIASSALAVSALSAAAFLRWFS